MLDYGNEDKIRQFQVVLTNHSDELLEEKLVDYLNFFEFIASLVQLKRLEINEVQSMFDYYIRDLGSHEFIMKYLEE